MHWIIKRGSFEWKTFMSTNDIFLTFCHRCPLLTWHQLTHSASLTSCQLFLWQLVNWWNIVSVYLNLRCSVPVPPSLNWSSLCLEHTSKASPNGWYLCHMGRQVPGHLHIRSGNVILKAAQPIPLLEFPSKHWKWTVGMMMHHIRISSLVQERTEW